MRKKSWRGIAITPLWKIVRQFLIKLNIYFPYNSAVALLGVYFHMKICMWLFIGTLFVIAPNWKQATCPSVGEIVVHTSPEMLCSNKKEQTIHIYILHNSRLYNSSTKIIEVENRPAVATGWRWQWVMWLYRDSMEEPCDWALLYLGSLNESVLGMKLHGRCTHECM